MLAIIEVGCAAGRLHAVAADIVEDPHVFNVSQVTGSAISSSPWPSPARRRRPDT